MKLEEYSIVGGKKLRCGYTTGSCAQAATKAAATILLKGEPINKVKIDTPAGIVLNLDVEDIEIGDDFVSCAIRKDAGDDPDITDDMLIYSKVSKRGDDEVSVDGGFGIGRIARKGLFGEVGEAAINPVPKKLILEELKRLGGGFHAEIYAPEGEKIGRSTFNAGIGIVGGISIIGTKGIVYPMSDEALIKSIYMEIDLLAQEGTDDRLLLTPGNHAINLAKSKGIKNRSIKVSNFIGDSISYAYEIGFKKFFILGHVGKLAKLALGIFNTHNRVADTRMESFVYYMAKAGVYDIIDEVDSCLTAERAALYLIENGYENIISDMERGAELRVKKYLKDEDIDIYTRMYTMERGLL
ncbi:MAG: cobalt-precorrin-5B (C(1))-methyltransferase CbiD [Tissierellia bacterium]|nr:cobalt-precorrin-5B (C(1))-methyltransferase CbiD [Tissierellia bacterium]